MCAVRSTTPSSPEWKEFWAASAFGAPAEGAGSLIRWHSRSVGHRVSLAPAARADVALHDLARFGEHEQRAGGAHPDILRTVLILRFLLRHFLLRPCAWTC